MKINSNKRRVFVNIEKGDAKGSGCGNKGIWQKESRWTQISVAYDDPIHRSAKTRRGKGNKVEILLKMSYIGARFLGI